MPKHIQQPSDKYIYFDFECDITTPEHQVNYCVAQYHDKPESFCFTSLDEFCEWAFDAEKHKGYTFMAHNGRGYDFQLVMKWVYEKTSLKPFTIYAGSKIMTFSVEKEYKIRLGKFQKSVPGIWRKMNIEKMIDDFNWTQIEY